MKKALARGFRSSSFMRLKSRDASKEAHSSDTQIDDIDSNLKLFLIPSKGRDDSSRPQYESYISMLWKVRDQVSLSHITYIVAVGKSIIFWMILYHQYLSFKFQISRFYLPVAHLSQGLCLNATGWRILPKYGNKLRTLQLLLITAELSRVQACFGSRRLSLLQLSH